MCIRDRRYTFPETEAAHILLNIGNRQGESGAVRDAYIKQIDGNTIEGYVITDVYKRQVLHRNREIFVIWIRTAMV